MIPVVNLSPLGVATGFVHDPAGALWQVVCVAAHHAIPAPGSGRGLVLADEQPPPPAADEHHGEPGVSSLARAGQLLYPRPGADIYLRGHAWAPRGRPARRSLIRARVASVDLEVLALGDRRWSSGLVGLRAGEPRPFTRIPVTYERSAGGPDEPRNPVGVGLHRCAREAADAPLPNFEDPRAPLRSPDERPEPVGFGPIPTHWSPRRERGGTYDSRWLEERAPFWPRDLDPRFFHLASPRLQCARRMRGGEAVELCGLHPDGPLRFSLPAHDLQLKICGPGGVRRERLTISGVDVDVDAMQVAVYYHGLVEAGPGAAGEACVRLREGWEDVPWV